MISFRYPIDINMSMCCLPRYLQDTFKIYQIIYLKDICDLYLEDILKIYGFDISVFPTHYYRKWYCKVRYCTRMHVFPEYGQQPMRKKNALVLLTILMEVGVIRTPRKVEQND